MNAYANHVPCEETAFGSNSSYARGIKPRAGRGKFLSCVPFQPHLWSQNLVNAHRSLVSESGPAVAMFPLRVNR